MSLPRHLLSIGAVLLIIVGAIVTRASATPTEPSGAFTVAFGPAVVEARSASAPSMREQELLRDLAFTPWIFAAASTDDARSAAWQTFTPDELLTFAHTPWSLVGGVPPFAREPIPTGPTFTHEYLTLIFFPWDALAYAALDERVGPLMFAAGNGSLTAGHERSGV
ncbi:MAG: hypothetical protein NZ518_02300 [Dehalococcoidia bacterium]|nr:hypothetical protein [Dehalococcoidia bacterium]